MFILLLGSVCGVSMWRLKAFSNLTSLVLLTTHELGLCMTEGLNNNTVPTFSGTLKSKRLSFPRLTVAGPGFEPRQWGLVVTTVSSCHSNGEESGPSWGGRRNHRMDWFFSVGPLKILGYLGNH